jgi:adenylate cyclase class IV
MLERELKAAVADPDDTRKRLADAGARPTFAGLMRDRRYDRDGLLGARDEVLRLRELHGRDGSHRARLGWKGPVRVADGYKLRPEHEIDVSDAIETDHLLQALGYSPSFVIDRYVECVDLGGAAIRLEWYPRMDVLIEIEGSAEAIERAVRAVAIPRPEFSAESLAEFVTRFERRRGERAAVSVEALVQLGGSPPGWFGG